MTRRRATTLRTVFAVAFAVTLFAAAAAAGAAAAADTAAVPLGGDDATRAIPVETTSSAEDAPAVVPAVSVAGFSDGSDLDGAALVSVAGFSDGSGSGWCGLAGECRGVLGWERSGWCGAGECCGVLGWERSGWCGAGECRGVLGWERSGWCGASQCREALGWECAGVCSPGERLRTPERQQSIAYRNACVRILRRKRVELGGDEGKRRFVLLPGAGIRRVNFRGCPGAPRPPG